MDPSQTQILSSDPNRTVMGAAPTINATQTIKPVQCPVCKTHNPAGMMFCVECGLIFDRALPDDAFGAPPVRLPVLVDSTGREHPIRAGENLVGREGDVMLTDPKVSRKHARILSSDGTFTVEDLGSTNGTELNGERLEPGEAKPLQPGDKVAFGGIELSLSMPGQAGATEMLSPHETAMGAPPSAAGAEGPSAAAEAEVEPSDPSGELLEESEGDFEAIQEPPSPGEPIVAFLVLDGEEKPLKAGVNTFGRRAENDVSISDPYVSGSHGQIEVEQDGIFLTDVGSTNGTFLNGEKLEPNARTALLEEDEVRIGGLVFSVKRAPDPSE